MQRFICLSFFAVLACYAAPSPPAQAALFGRFDTIQGSSLDPQHDDWSDLTSLRVDYDVSGTEGPGAGSTATVGIRIRYAMNLDGSYPSLLQAFFRRDVLSDVQFEEWAPLAGASRRLVRYELTDARLGDLAVSHSAAGTATLAGTIDSAEQISVFSYSYNSAGVLTGSTLASYNFVGGGQFQLAPPSGDYNADGSVDDLDHSAWVAEFGEVPASLGVGADGNGDLLVDAADYVVWRDNLGSSAAAGYAAPEPAGVALLLVALGVARAAAPRR